MMRIIYAAIIAAVAVAMTGAMIYRGIFVTMSWLPEGDIIGRYMSPTGEYTVNMYAVELGELRVPCIRGELVEGRQKRNIYWQRNKKECSVYWLSEETVHINGIELNIHEDIYDWRRHGD